MIDAQVTVTWHCFRSIPQIVGSTGINDFYNQFSRLLQGRFGGHKHLKVLVLKNQQQRW